MKKLKCMVVDDEKASLDILSHLIRQRPDLILVEATQDPLSVVDKVRNLNIELLFVDLNMDLMHGVDVIKAVLGQTDVICCTGYNQYGPELFELDVAYYLTKPISTKGFDKAIERVWKRKSNNVTTGQVRNADLLDLDDYILLRLKNSKFINLQLIEIECLEGDGDGTYLTYAEGKIRVSSTLKNLEQKLPAAHFVRVHQSYIIARKNIGNVDFSTNEMTLRNSWHTGSIPIGRSYGQRLKVLS